jgi:hypothetical protein
MGASTKPWAKPLDTLQHSIFTVVLSLTSRKMICYGPQVSRGAVLVARLRGETAEQGLIATSTEEELLAVACDLADRIALLQNIVAIDGERRVAKDGTVRLHPALAETRQCEATLTRVVSAIRTMEEPEKNPVKQKAAQSRWRAHRLAHVERERRTADPHGT